MYNSLYTCAPATASKTYGIDALNRYTKINGGTTTFMRATANRHPIGNLLGTIEHLLPRVRLPFQYSNRGRGYG
jgi:hypothetical protein